MTAQLRPINLVAPGFRGVNFAQSGAILSPQFATVAQNAVIDTTGRLAARSGFSDLTTTDISSNPTVKTLFEFRRDSGAVETLLAWDGGIANDVADPAGNDISGSVVDADGRWWLQNFRDSVVGFQDGQKPIVYTGTGNFATVVESNGTAPTSKGGVGLCAFGRVWGLDADGQTIKYSALLDETDWGSAGAGSIDMTSVWTDGTDEVRAIWAFNGQLIVFGRHHIVFWYDGQGSALGLDPENIIVNDVVTGTGCLTQWSIQPVGETDLLYLSPNGVQSIRRVVQSGSANPISTLTKNIRNDLLEKLQFLSDADTIRTVYSPIDGFYLLTIPFQQNPQIIGITYCIDQRYPYQDEAGEVLNIITTWTLAPTAWLSKTDFSLNLGATNGVGLYAGQPTDDGAQFRFIYQSPWLDLGEQFADFLKILKRLGAIILVLNSVDIVFKWSVDFDESSESISTLVEADASDEWGAGEWGIAQWSGGLTLRIIKIPARSTGQYFRIAIEADVSSDFSIQETELFTKIGRLA